MLYSYNLTLNLDTGKYSLIVGTGMRDFVKIFESTDDYQTAYSQKIRYVAEDYLEAFDSFSSLSALRSRKDETGYIGNLEYSAKTEKGVEWHEINIFLGTDENGDPIANILGRDITEAHQQQEIKERELRASTAKDQLLSGVTKMLYSYNMTVNVETGRYTLITGTGLDKTVARMQKTDQYEEIYQTFLRGVQPEYRQRGVELLSLESYRGKTDKTGHLGTEEFPLGNDGRIEWHEINVFAGYDENGEAIINILGRDVTEAHDKADTKAQLEIANAANAAKSAFLFNMSHDIRTPMNAIIGFTNLLEKHLDDEKLAKDYIRKIQSSNDFLLSLINNVLEMARIESGKATLDETYWNAYRFNDSLFSLFDSQMKAKGIEFTRTAHVEHPEVICDETKLREIFLNILSNALKYTPAGGKVSMRLTELPSDRPGYALYQTVIEDTGIGMSREFLPHLFDEFTRERSSTESRVNGTGLGMPIVKKLVNLMQGTVEVESEIGRGTKITVQTIRRISNRKKAGIPIIAMTANAFDEDKRNAYMAGMNWHIAKPIIVSELMSALNDILNKNGSVAAY